MKIETPAGPHGIDNIGARLGGHIMALDLARAQDILLTRWPDDAATPRVAAIATGPLQVPKGERYGVARRVAVMPVRGILTPDSVLLERYFGWATYQGIETACAEIAANEDVSAAVLDMNSPGGMVLGLDGAAKAIAALAAVKPVHVLINPLAASAAYWLASQGTRITLTPGSEVGSIGTTRNSVWPVQPDAWGDQWGIHVSSHARAKIPNPTSDEGGVEIQRSLDEAETRFLDAVAAGRKLDRAGLPARLSVTDDAADGGAMYRAADAIERGLADDESIRAAFYDQIMSAYAPQSGGAPARALGPSAQRQAALAKAQAAL